MSKYHDERLIGKTIEIMYMDGEPNYRGRSGIVKSVDAIGQLHGTWGGLAIDPNLDLFVVVEDSADEI